MTNTTTVDDIKKRRKHFRREPDFKPENSRAGRIEIRRRDLDMLAAIAKHRFLNTVQVCRVFACTCPRIEKMGLRGGKPVMILVKQHRGNCACICAVKEKKREHAEGCPALFKDDQHVASRLRELYQAGYLERPIVQLQLRIKNGVTGEGSVPMVYCITAAGLALIGTDRRGALGHGKRSWVHKLNEGKNIFMEHTLATADVSIGIDMAVRKHPLLERLTEQQLFARMHEDRKTSVRPWSLKIRYKGEELSAVCDLTFAVGNTSTRKRWNFMVEVDRGHMPVERNNLRQTSIMRKLIAYAKAHEDNQHATEFGWKSFRVLILTTSDQRVRSCVKACRDRFGSASVARIFLFGTQAASHDMLGYQFIDVNGKPVCLIDDL